MTGQAESAVNDPISPHLVSGVFVQQYYHILHEQPEKVHKFYQDSSILGRPEPNGTMVSVTTLPTINEAIMSMDFKNCLIEIETADAQLSHMDGVLIIVTGSLTPSEGICRRFTQSFFLAPQDSGGYFVLNDVFRFISERQPAEINQVATRENESCQIATSASETFSALLPELTTAEKSLNSDHVTVVNNVTERQVINSSVNRAAVEYKVTTKPPGKVTKEGPKRAPVAASTHRNVTKKSYASIVKDMKEGPLAMPIAKTTPSVPKLVPPPEPVTKVVEDPVKSLAKPAQGKQTTASDGVVAENNNLLYENGYSVFVRNLPMYANIGLVEEEFKKFGVVKLGGVQVVHYKFDGFCFGFVEYASQQSMQAAIEASPICIGMNHVFIEKKRTPTRVTRGRIYPRGDSGQGGHFQAGRGVYHGDDFGGQGGGYTSNTNYRGAGNFNHKNEGCENYNRSNDGGKNYNSRNDGGESYNRRNDGGENYNRRNDGGENYNHRNDRGENYNRRNDCGENYNRRNDGSEKYNHRGDAAENNLRGNVGENYNRRGDGGENNNRRGNVGENYNSRNGGGENYNPRGDSRENYNRRNDGENYNRRGDGGENNSRRGNVGENYNHRNDGGENYNHRSDSGENNRKGHMVENYNCRYDGGENYKRGGDGSENYNHWNDDGENYNHKSNGGENFNRRADGENFNRRNFRKQNELSGGRGHGPPPGNAYYQNYNGFHQPRPVQNGNSRPARANSPKQAPSAA